MVRAKSQFRGRLEHIVRHRKPPKKTRPDRYLRNSGTKSAPKFQPAATKTRKCATSAPPSSRARGQTKTQTARTQLQQTAMCTLPRPCNIRPGDVRELQASGIWRSDVRGLHDARKRPSTSAQLHQPSSPAMNRQQRRDRFIPTKSTHQSGNTPAK